MLIVLVVQVMLGLELTFLHIFLLTLDVCIGAGVGSTNEHYVAGCPDDRDYLEISDGSSTQRYCGTYEKYETQYFNGRAYMLLETKRSWAEQQTYCNTFGGQLASIPNVETNNFLLAMIKQETFVGGRTVDESEWSWTDGTPFTFTNWASSEPYPSDGLVIELVKGHKSRPDGTWNGVRQSEAKHALCQKTDGGEFVTPTPSLPAPVTSTSSDPITVKLHLVQEDVSGTGFQATVCCSAEVTTDDVESIIFSPNYPAAHEGNYEQVEKDNYDNNLLWPYFG